MRTAIRPNKPLAASDMDDGADWHRIERAIDELRRTVPGHGEGVH